MKRLTLVAFIIISLGFSKLSAQIHELGVFVGGSNYIGDVGKTDYFIPNEMAYGVLYKWNQSRRHAWRVSYIQSKLNGNDLKASESARVQRGYKFFNNIKEISAGLEFNFFDFDLNSFSRNFTPYIYSGISYTNFDEKYFVNGVSKTDSNKYTLAIPIIIGVKTRINQNFVLAAELGARYTYSDNLDGSNPKSDNLKAFRFGNTNSRDWYVFSGFTLTYSFGDKPCYCKN